MPGALQFLADQRLEYALGVIDVVVAVPALHTKIAVIDGRVEGRRDPLYEVIFDVQLQSAPHPTIGAGGGHHAIGGDMVFLYVSTGEHGRQPP